MRILVGHVFGMPEVKRGVALPGREGAADEILGFGFAYPEFPYHKGMGWREILARCPQGWKPDIYLHWSPEYNPLPLGMEEADCLKAGVFGDWNLGGQAIRAVGAGFDVLVADAPGCALLRQAGFSQVVHGMLWAQDPDLHRVLPNTTRDIDILMIGNFNHAVQQERSHWLARVARLSERYRVLLTSGVFGEEYVRMMNRAKIVFNRSIRGELNMRSYEAPACGALMFYERENAEVLEVFEDRKDCVLYGDEDLEALLDHYLAPENAAERERIAAAGAARVQKHTYSHHFGSLLNDLEPYVRANRRIAVRPAAKAQAQQALLSYEPALASSIADLLERTDREAQTPQQRSVALGLHGAFRSVAGQLSSSPLDRNLQHCAALPHLQQAVAEWQDNALALNNLGRLLLASNAFEEGAACLEKAIALLERPEWEPETWEGTVFPRQFDYTLVQQERLSLIHAPASPEWRDAMRPLLISRIRLALATERHQNARYSQAIAWAQEAVALTPQNPEARFQLARSLRAIGRAEEAIPCYQETLRLSPFTLEAWEELAQLFLDLNRPQEAIATLQDLLRMLQGTPFYASNRTHAERMRQTALAMARQGASPRPKTCLVAFPDWDNDEDWQNMVAAFARAYRPADKALLMLRANPETHPNAQALLTRLYAYLTQELRLPAGSLPGITLLNQRMSSDDLWKAFRIADACLITDSLNALCRELAASCRVPLCSPEELSASSAA